MLSQPVRGWLKCYLEWAVEWNGAGQSAWRTVEKGEVRALRVTAEGWPVRLGQRYPRTGGIRELELP